MFNLKFNSIVDVIKNFDTEEKCIAYLEELLWSNGPVSPFDQSSQVYRCQDGKYQCRNTKKYFTIKTGTIFHGTHVELPLWFVAIYLVSTTTKGVSSVQLTTYLKVISQKTAWFMLHQIRQKFDFKFLDEEQFDGVCEADETFVGGLNKNRHKDKKVPKSQGRSFKDKTPIVGILKRGESEIITRPHKQMPHVMVEEKVPILYSQVRTKVVRNTRKKSIQPFILENVVSDSDTVIVTDEWHAYKGLDTRYDHHVVDHKKKQYVDYDNNEIHSNSIEGFWSILKRGYHGTYNRWSPKHMQKYSDEFSWRFNLRGVESDEKINLLLLNCHGRLKYRDLINGKD